MGGSAGWLRWRCSVLDSDTLSGSSLFSRSVQQRNPPAHSIRYTQNGPRPASPRKHKATRGTLPPTAEATQLDSFAGTKRDLCSTGVHIDFLSRSPQTLGARSKTFKDDRCRLHSSPTSKGSCGERISSTCLQG